MTERNVIPAPGTPSYRRDDPWEVIDLDRERAEFLAAESAEDRAYREWIERMETEI